MEGSDICPVAMFLSKQYLNHKAPESPCVGVLGSYLAIQTQQ